MENRLAVISFDAKARSAWPRYASDRCVCLKLAEGRFNGYRLLGPCVPVLQAAKREPAAIDFPAFGDRRDRFGRAETDFRKAVNGERSGFGRKGGEFLDNKIIGKPLNNHGRIQSHCETFSARSRFCSRL